MQSQQLVDNLRGSLRIPNTPLKNVGSVCSISRNDSSSFSNVPTKLARLCWIKSLTSNAYQCSTPSEVWFLPFLMQVAFSGSFVGSPYKSPSLRKWTQYTQCRAFYIQVCWLGYYLIELVKQGTLVSLWFFSEPNPFGANTLFQGHLQIMLIHIFTLLSTVIRFSFPSITTWYDRLKHVIWLIKTNQK